MPHPDLYRPLGCQGQKRGRLRVERLDQRLGLFEIGRIEAFGEPVVDRRRGSEPVARLGTGENRLAAGGKKIRTPGPPQD